MAKMMLVYDIYSDASTTALGGGTWTLPLDYMQDPRPRKKARSGNATLAATQFTVDLGSSKTLRTFILCATNVSSAALYKITRYSDAFVTAIDNTGWLAVPGYPADDPDTRGVDIVHVYSTDTAARYWKVEINDTANSAGYVEIGRLLIGATYIPQYNFGANNADGLEPNTPRTLSLGGTAYYNRRRPARSFKFGWERVYNTELITLRRIRLICNLDKQVFFIPDPDDTTYFNARNFLATLRSSPSMLLLPASLARADFELIEAV